MSLNWSMNNDMNNTMNLNMNNPINNNMNNMMNNNMFQNWNNMNNPMGFQWNLFLQNFYNQMMAMNTMQMQNQMAACPINPNNINNNATDRLPKTKENVVTDPFAHIPGPRSNLIFQTCKGHKVTIPSPFNIPIHQVLVQYIIKVGLGPGALYDGFYFLFNGAKILVNDEKTLVGDLAKTGQANIIVLDTKNLIGS